MLCALTSSDFCFRSAPQKIVIRAVSANRTFTPSSNQCSYSRFVATSNCRSVSAFCKSATFCHCSSVTQWVAWWVIVVSLVLFLPESPIFIASKPNRILSSDLCPSGFTRCSVGDGPPDRVISLQLHTASAWRTLLRIQIHAGGRTRHLRVLRRRVRGKFLA